ncbi:MAG: mandelate racemase/muconate lactonizing enzyme family protein [Proteobacteria bacterium]|nr:mandelate racemase/muconate lactonizing enzyme family protein [Pseudomonadota bacterium]
MTAAPILRIEPVFLRISEKTVWSFLSLTTKDGRSAIGEATLQGKELVLREEIGNLASAFAGLAADPEQLPPLSEADARNPARAAAYSALDQALWDIAAQRLEKPLCNLLGAKPRDRIPLYANINRRTVDRSPDGFAASARDARALGYQAIKIAPFDGLSPRIASTKEGKHLIDAGLVRIAALRSTIGAEPMLLVDCHWRLDEASAATVLREVHSFDLYWLECPLPETPENLDALVRLRHIANDLGIRLAGAETRSLLTGFQPFLTAGAYDVMMPDVKYAGGLKEMLRIAEAFARAGVAFSPHNPTGPVAHAVSLHAAAVADGFTYLETQFDESPLFRTIVAGDLPQPEAGVSRLPHLPGHGLRLRNGGLPMWEGRPTVTVGSG